MPYAAKFGVFVDEDHRKIPMLYRFPKLINDPISHVLLIMLVHVLLQGCLFF